MYLWLKDHNKLIESLLASKKTNLELHEMTDKQLSKLFHNDKVLEGLCKENVKKYATVNKNIKSLQMDTQLLDKNIIAVENNTPFETDLTMKY